MKIIRYTGGIICYTSPAMNENELPAILRLDSLAAAIIRGLTERKENAIAEARKTKALGDSFYEEGDLQEAGKWHKQALAHWETAATANAEIIAMQREFIEDLDPELANVGWVLVDPMGEPPSDKPEFYCHKHKYNPEPNSGLSFCPKCEFPDGEPDLVTERRSLDHLRPEDPSESIPAEIVAKYHLARGTVHKGVGEGDAGLPPTTHCRHCGISREDWLHGTGCKECEWPAPGNQTPLVGGLAGESDPNGHAVS